MNRIYFNSTRNFNKTSENGCLSLFMKSPSSAWASVRGYEKFPSVKGAFRFYQMNKGVLVVSEFDGLPGANSLCESPIFAFHINGGDFEKNDFPPLYSSKGYAFLTFVTSRFKVKEISGKTIILHSPTDDFSAQSSHILGEKIACGVIVPV